MLLWRRLAGLGSGRAPRRLRTAPGQAQTQPQAEGPGPGRTGDGDGALRPLYMDVQATTPLDPRVLDSMLPYLTAYYGNPHSRTHAYGWESEAAMEKARRVSLHLHSHGFPAGKGIQCQKNIRNNEGKKPVL
ncbi:PREDICTED: cysteine desulfurase, mitochondrial-like, partial [Lepidothrix coronata]|uniref:Cysteine desulfurase, mitochondrial-like n=1 Tax=Lepidothrix coronata TaxID=321398 RepID=A0A6J0GEK2_9PASS